MNTGVFLALAVVGAVGCDGNVVSGEESPGSAAAVDAFEDDAALALAAEVGAAQAPGEPNEGCVGPAVCEAFAWHSPDCSYNATVAASTYDFCCGPIVWVDTTHQNWHQITPESQAQPGRYWGFAELLFADGYDVRDSEAALDELVVGEGPDILVIASPYRPDAEPDALTPAETQAVVAWVEGGGSLLLVFDHPPFDRVGGLLTEFGLAQLPAGADTLQTNIFRRFNGTLNSVAATTQGVWRVSSFRGSSLEIVDDPPGHITYEPTMTFGPNAQAWVGNEWVPIPGTYGGIMLDVGQGRVYVSAEAAMFTAQTTNGGVTQVGMHITPFNERFLLNVIHWLDHI